VDGWGKKSEVRCETILGLRKEERNVNGVDLAGKESDGVDGVVKFDNNDKTTERVNEPERKKARVLSLEEYEAVLDQDSTFNDIDLNFGSQ
jgi:hypothetical protein